MDVEEKRLYIKLAYGYYQNKEYKKAIGLYGKLQEADPDDFNIINMLGDTYSKAGLKDKALEAYVDTLAALEKKGQSTRMIKLCKKTLKLFPMESRVKTKLSIAMRNIIRDAERKVMYHQYEEARDIYESIKDLNSEEYPINFKLSQLNDEEMKYKERNRKLEEQKAPKKGDPQQELISKFDKMAQNYLSNGDFDGAVETYITALKLAPNNQDLRTKLHKVYMTIANQSASERVWEKIDSSPKDQIEEAKRKAMEERQAKIMEEEEERAKKLLNDEEKFQNDLELQEREIVQAAASELKIKLDEAQKKEKLKEEEIQRIMREQEAKKRELREKVKREAVEKWKKQKAAVQEEKKEDVVVELPPMPAPAEPEKKASLMDHLKGTSKTPKLDESAATTASRPEDEKIKIEIKKPVKAPSPLDEEQEKTEIVVNEDTLDSLITTAYIYINQGIMKEAMRIYNKITEKYPEHPEAKQMLEEITKREKG